MTASMWLEQALGHQVAGDLDRADAMTLTAKIKSYAGVTWILLSEAHTRRADRAMGYDSWADYVAAEFDMSRSYAYRLIAHSQAVHELAEAAGIDVSPIGDIAEGATRNLDVESVAAEVEAQAAVLGADATDEDRAEIVRGALAKAKQTTTLTETTTTTFDPETGEIIETSGEEGDAGGSPDGPAATTVHAPSSPVPPATPKATPEEQYRVALRGLLGSALRLPVEFPDQEHNLAVHGKDRDLFLSDLRGLAEWIEAGFAAAEGRPHLKAVQN